VVLVRAVDLGEEDAGEPAPAGGRRRIGGDQALEHHRLVLDGAHGATRHSPAGQRVTHELTERLEHPSEQRVEEAPRAPQREHQRSEPPFDMPRTDRYHDEREAGERHRHAQDPAHHPAQARRICEVHGEQVDRARPAAQPTHAHFTRSLYVSDLLSRREFLASTAVGVAATGAYDIPFPMRPPQPLPPRSRWAAKPVAAAGAVGALEGIKTPSEVAKLVLKYTNHIFLVGEGAKRFALQYGFKEEDLLTPHAREVWLHWRANLNPNDDYLDVPEAQDMSVRP